MEAANLAYQAQRPTAPQLSSTLTQIREVVTHLRDDWYQDSVTNQEKKDLLRCVIERVTLEKQAGDKVLRAEICWQDGATSTVEVPKYLYSAPHLFHRITALARELPDAQIAEALNAEGLQTVKGRPWSQIDREWLSDYRRSCSSPGDQSNDRAEMLQTGPAVRETCRRAKSFVD